MRLLTPYLPQTREALPVKRVSHGLDRIRVDFDDANLVANAGLLLVGTLVVRLALEQLVDSTLQLAGRAGGFRPGRKVLTLVHSMVAGGSHIDHADVLRAGNTAGVLPHRVMAPSTLGTFLRSFTFGHVRQLEAVIGTVLERAWALGAGPGERRLVIDVDSTICQVEGKKKQALRSVTPGCWATTRSWPAGPIPARSCTPACAKDQPTPLEGPAGSSTSSSPACAGPAPPARSCCEWTPGSGPTTRSRRSPGWGCATRWRFAPTPKAWPPPSPPWTRATGGPL